eukprot:TRINITY_DN3990_c0_g2_i1.p1 TRINITY_DN3990_c0_g2~~TRINITY_DN3990_c0_g2_i1.p1  ORF type:complete len:344 (+),score=84.03 TRINITY_DN3990_c0_g2_i1:192-1223(+)
MAYYCYDANGNWRCDGYWRENRWYYGGCGYGGWRRRYDGGWWRRPYVDKLEENIMMMEEKIDKMSTVGMRRKHDYVNDDYMQTQERLAMVGKIKDFEPKMDEKVRHMNETADEVKVLLMKKIEEDNCWRWWSSNGGHLMNVENADNTMVANLEKLGSVADSLGEQYRSIEAKIEELHGNVNRFSDCCSMHEKFEHHGQPFQHGKQNDGEPDGKPDDVDVQTEITELQKLFLKLEKVVKLQGEMIVKMNGNSDNISENHRAAVEAEDDVMEEPILSSCMAVEEGSASGRALMANTTTTRKHYDTVEDYLPRPVQAAVQVDARRQSLLATSGNGSGAWTPCWKKH